MNPIPSQSGEPMDSSGHSSDPEDLGTILARLLGRLGSGGAGNDALPESEAEPPRCPVCDDRGFVYPAVEITDPGYGRGVICACRREQLPERIGRHWATMTGIPKRFRELRLATHPNLTGRDPQTGRLWNPGLAELLAGADYRTASWYLWGETGRGKTGIAAAYAWAYLWATEESVLWWSVPDLLDALKGSYGRDGDGPSEAELLRRCRDCGLLILDDLGVEYLRDGGEWTKDRLYQIIAGRHAAARPLIVTSEFDLNATRRRLNDRIAWRIGEMCGPTHDIELRGPNLRAGGPL